MNRVLLHIGIHRTGTTSIQQFLRDHPDLLAEHGAAFPLGFLAAQPNNHVELHVLSMRPDRLSPARIHWPETTDPRWLAAARDHVRATVAAPEPPTLVYSAEGLSYLRFDDEIARVVDLMAGRTVDVVMFAREPAAFLASYEHNLRMLGLAPSTDPDSVAYVQPGSWLADHAARAERWGAAVGAEHVTVIDYDAAVARDGSVIPALAACLGVEHMAAVAGYFLNARPRPDPAAGTA